MRKTLTPKEYRELLLQQTLLRGAYDAKRYYQDGFYKPDTTKINAARSVRQYYDAIDEIGLRISSGLYQSNTPDGISYKRETKEITKKLLTNIENDLRNGVLTSQTYNDLVGYFSQVVESAQVGEFEKRKNKKEDPVNDVKQLISQNLTNLDSKTIIKLLKEVGATGADIRQTLIDMKNAKAMGLQYEPQDLPGGPGGDTAMVDNSMRNIANPLPQTFTGENNGYETVLYGTQPIERVPVGAGNTQQYRATTDAAIQQLQSQQMATNTYGIIPSEFESSGADEFLMDIGQQVSITSMQNISNEIERMADELARKYDGFMKTQFVDAARRKVSVAAARLQSQVAGGGAAATSPEALASQRSVNAARENDARESTAQATAPPPHLTQDAQASAGLQNFPIEASIRQLIDAQKPRDKEFLEYVIKNGAYPDDILEMAREFEANVFERFNSVFRMITFVKEYQKNPTDEIAPEISKLLQVMRGIPTNNQMVQLFSAVDKRNPPLPESITGEGEILEDIQGRLNEYRELEPYIETKMGLLRHNLASTFGSAVEVYKNFLPQTLPQAESVPAPSRGTEAADEAVQRAPQPGEVRNFNVELDNIMNSSIDKKMKLTRLDELQQSLKGHGYTAFNLKNKPKSERYEVIEMLKDNPNAIMKSVSQARIRVQLAKDFVERMEEKQGQGRRKKGGSRFDGKEFNAIAVPAMTAQNPDPPMRYVVAGERRNGKAHSYTIG